MATTVAATPGTIIISVSYDETGLARATLYDNEAISWTFSRPGSEPIPTIIGSLPPFAPITPPISSPQWAKLTGAAVFVPDTWRGGLSDFFTWLATNGGANRKLEKQFGANSDLFNAFDRWAIANPGLVYSG